MANVKKVDVLLEDFNINAALSNEPYAGVSNVFTEYKLMASEPTYMDAGLLDHLYLMRQFLFGKQVTSIVKNIYLSHHDAVKVHIPKSNREEINRDMDFSVS